jgi:hypothetical protein
VVGVPCPGCGREYDAALFGFGRTLTCACGRRVGLEPRRRTAGEDGGPEGPRFIVDAMLGRLARWLRVLGFDTTFEADIDDALLVRRALAEERWILTRDRALPVEWRVPRVHLVVAETPFEQLREVARVFGLAAGARPFRRCSRCNTLLEPLDARAAATQVPARVLERHGEFRRCPGCGRVYWPGTHAERMRRVVERALAAD